MLHDGINPAVDKKVKRAIAQAEARDTFKAIAEEWYGSEADKRSKP